MDALLHTVPNTRPLRRYAKVAMLRATLYDLTGDGDPVVSKIWVPIKNDTVRNLFDQFLAVAHGHAPVDHRNKRKRGAPVRGAPTQLPEEEEDDTASSTDKRIVIDLTKDE